MPREGAVCGGVRSRRGGRGLRFSLKALKFPLTELNPIQFDSAQVPSDGTKTWQESWVVASAPARLAKKLALMLAAGPRGREEAAPLLVSRERRNTPIKHMERKGVQVP